MLMRFRMTIAYDGTRYHGFQRQIGTDDWNAYLHQGFAQPDIQRKEGVTGSNNNNVRKRQRRNGGGLGFPPPRIAKHRHTLAPATSKTNSKNRMKQCRNANDNNVIGESVRLDHYAVTVQECFEHACWVYARSIIWQQQRSEHVNRIPPPLQFSVQDLNLKFASRTDKGVHARGQVVAVTLPCGPLSNNNNDAAIPSPHNNNCLSIRQALNSRLPDDISVQHVLPLLMANAAWEPRNTTQIHNKLYSYTIKYRAATTMPPRFAHAAVSVEASTTASTAAYSISSAMLRSAWDQPDVWLCPWPLFQDSALLQNEVDAGCYWNALEQGLQGTHNYAVFVHKDERRRKQREQHDSNNNEADDDPAGATAPEPLQIVRTIDRIWHQVLHVEPLIDDECAKTSHHDAIVTLRWYFQAPGFGRGMIRLLVGYMVDVARGVIPAAAADVSADALLWSGRDDVAAHIHAAPACGLCLERIVYRCDNVGSGDGCPS